MSSKEFYDLVVNMREAQKMYFRTRRSDDLKMAKEYEKAVDAEIKRVRDYINGADLPPLF